MKIYKYITLFVVVCTSLLFVQCADDDDNGNVIVQETCEDGIQNGEETGIDCGGPDCPSCGEELDFSGIYVQEDQVGRPGINTVLGTDGMKDAFNVTVPTKMQTDFQASFEAKLLELNPGYTTNILNLDAATFTTTLSRDVLWLAQTGTTTYYSGIPEETLTGRALHDDVIDVTLTLIYGGSDGTENPTFTNDGVPANDAAFLTSFPYLASPFK